MSAQDIESYREFVSKLQNDEHRREALNDIKNLIELISANTAATIIRNGGITKLMNCLNVGDKADIELAYEVLRMCMKTFEPGVLVKNYTSHTMYLLRHPINYVRRLPLLEVSNVIEKDCNLLPIPDYIDVFVAVAQLVADEDGYVSQCAIEITSNLPHEAYPKVLEEMKITLEYNSSAKCNAFQVIINISQKSSELLNLSAEMGYIDCLVTGIQSDDVLYQANILELMSKLAITPHGINYLIKNDVMKKIAELAADSANNPLASIILPGYLKFFGTLAHHYPREIIEKYPVLLDLLFDSLDSREESILLVALDTLGYVGMKIEGKLCLAAIGSRYTQAVTKVGQMINEARTDVKIRALSCYACLIDIDKDSNAPKTGPIHNRVTLMTREWFRSLSENSMETLFKYCKNPFPEIRVEAFNLLDTICQHHWGLELVAMTAGFIEYLLDRSADHTKECKETKYGVIKRLSNSAVFDANIIMRLQTYVKQGPFFSETNLEVALEGED